jgi:hypothetical protein
MQSFLLSLLCLSIQKWYLDCHFMLVWNKWHDINASQHINIKNTCFYLKRNYCWMYSTCTNMPFRCDRDICCQKRTGMMTVYMSPCNLNIVYHNPAAGYPFSCILWDIWGCCIWIATVLGSVTLKRKLHEKTTIILYFFQSMGMIYVH